jgi:hypothetical protein
VPLASFRPAGESDLGLLLELMRALYDEDGSTPLRGDAAETALRGLLAAPDRGLVWVIEQGGEAVGYLVLTWGYSLEFHGRDALSTSCTWLRATEGQGSDGRRWSGPRTPAGPTEPEPCISRWRSTTSGPTRSIAEAASRSAGCAS